VVSPNTLPERANQLARHSSGFLYLVSVTGVTGVREELAQGLEEFLSNTRQLTDLPLAVGFGIAAPQQAKTVGKIADGVIVGSAIIRTIEQNPHDPASAVQKYVQQLAEALNPPQ